MPASIRAVLSSIAPIGAVAVLLQGCGGGLFVAFGDKIGRAGHRLKLSLPNLSTLVTITFSIFRSAESEIVRSEAGTIE